MRGILAEISLGGILRIVAEICPGVTGRILHAAEISPRGDGKNFTSGQRWKSLWGGDGRNFTSGQRQKYLWGVMGGILQVDDGGNLSKG
jgi:hypothetical protein